MYLSARTNHGACLGHQFADWASAYSLADRYGLTFVHQPFAFWEKFLQFGKGEVQFADMGDAPVIGVPRFDFVTEIEVFEKAIASARPESILHLSTDQFIPYANYSLDKLRTKWRQRQRVTPPAGVPYLATHIRRGQIMEWTPEARAGWYMPNEYFVRVVGSVLDKFPLESHIFSMGTMAEFPEFDDRHQFHLGKDENDWDSAGEAIERMIDADILVMSKSGFSYMAALLGDGIKIVHPYWTMFDTSRWIQCDVEGNFDIQSLVEKYPRRT